MRWRGQLAALAAALAAALVAAPARADHPVAGMRSQGWDPVTAALVFGGLALLAGAVVVIVVAILTRRDSPSGE